MIQNVSLLNFLKKLEKEEHITEYLFVYYGKINNDIIVTSIQMLVEKLKMEGYSKTHITKTKLLAIEVLQNVIHHQTIHPETHPYFIVGADDKTIKIVSGNVVSKEDKEVIVQKLDDFISRDKSDLEKDYKFALKQNKLTNAGNAGLGLIDIVCRANKQVKYKLKKLEKGLFLFNLHVLID